MVKISPSNQLTALTRRDPAAQQALGSLLTVLDAGEKTRKRFAALI
jgi:hypothetical protein